jgi:hypothetical protein
MLPRMSTVVGHRSWEDICADPVLRNLPYKIETNARGQIVMSPPARNEHSGFQQRIAARDRCWSMPHQPLSCRRRFPSRPQ